MRRTAIRCTAGFRDGQIASCVNGHSLRRSSALTARLKMGLSLPNPGRDALPDTVGDCSDEIRMCASPMTHERRGLADVQLRKLVTLSCKVDVLWHGLRLPTSFWQKARANSSDSCGAPCPSEAWRILSGDLAGCTVQASAGRGHVQQVGYRKRPIGLPKFAIGSIPRPGRETIPFDPPEVQTVTSI